MTLSWTPRRNGERYCSPACGHGCTWKEYEVAVQKATELAELSGWEPRVWENLGWHYAVNGPVWNDARKDRFSMHYCESGYFITNGPSDLCPGSFHETPELAIKAWRKHLLVERDKVQAVLDQLPE